MYLLIDCVVEEFVMLGYIVVESGLSEFEFDDFFVCFEVVCVVVEVVFGGCECFEVFDEYNMLCCVFKYDWVFFVFVMMFVVC